MCAISSEWTEITLKLHLLKHLNAWRDSATLLFWQIGVFCGGSVQISPRDIGYSPKRSGIIVFPLMSIVVGCLQARSRPFQVIVRVLISEFGKEVLDMWVQIFPVQSMMPMYRLTKIYSFQFRARMSYYTDGADLQIKERHSTPVNGPLCWEIMIIF